MKHPLLVTLILALLAFWLPASSQSLSPQPAPTWPPDLTRLIERPYGPGWSPPLHYLKPISQLGGTTRFVLVQGTTAYIAHGPRFQILDVADPASPRVLGQTGPLQALVSSVALARSVAYVTLDGPGVPHIFDVSDPARPVLLGTCDACGPARRVVVAGNLAYLAAGGRGLEIVDVSNPQQPVLLSTLDTPGDAWDVAVSQTTAYIADWYGGLRIVDVATPARPHEVGNFPTRGEAKGIALAFPVWGWYVASVAFVALGSGGMTAINVISPNSPVEIASIRTPGDAEAVGVAGSIAAVADGSGGLTLVSLLRDQQVATIRPAGGSIATDDGSMIAIFPAGAFAETVLLTYQRLAAEEDSGDLLGVGQPFEFRAFSAASGRPVELVPGSEFALVLRYDDYELGSAIEPSLRLNFQRDGLWQPERTSQVHVQANALTAMPRQLGWWTALGRTRRTLLPQVTSSLH